MNDVQQIIARLINEKLITGEEAVILLTNLKSNIEFPKSTWTSVTSTPIISNYNDNH